MPAPIWPAPMTPTVSMLKVIFSSSRQRAPRHDHKRATPSVQSDGGIFSSIRRTLAADLGELRGKLGQRRVQIGDKAVVGNLKDRRLLVLVDRDDDLRILHPRQMLDRARDADRDIKFGRH